MLESQIRVLQEKLVERARRFLSNETLDESAIAAFYETPRHWFAPRFPNGKPGLWSEASEALLEANLTTLYADQPFCIYQDDSGRALSTISQPSLVLFMLHLLELEPGMRVFELGGGSGWNAAMMGRMVGPSGRVISVEALAGLGSNALRAIAHCGLSNVSWVPGDASELIADHAPFDRGVFTASAWSLPALFFDCIKENGLLLFVFEFDETKDLLAVLRKRSGKFASELHFPCRFVSATGAAAAQDKLPSDEERLFQEWLSQSDVDAETLDLEIVPASQATENRASAHRYVRGDCVFQWSPPVDGSKP